MADERNPVPADKIDLTQSVAGEEDPGASVDMAVPTPAADEDICRTCGGDGLLNGGPCPDCEGIGKIDVGDGAA